MDIDTFLKNLDTKAKEVGLVTAKENLHEKQMPISELRRFRIRTAIDDVHMVTLTHGSNGFRWVPKPWMPSISGESSEYAVRQYRFEDMKPSNIQHTLKELDIRINPQLSRIGQRNTTLLRWRQRSLTKLASSQLSGKVLLIVHAQWSSGNALHDQFRITLPGRKLLANLLNHYDFVVSFEHPTISSSPTSNAIDLMVDVSAWSDADVDILAHGRGGLIARYTFEVLVPRIKVGKIIFVGSAVGGSGESYKSHLVETLSFLTNTAFVCQGKNDLIKWLDFVPRILSLYVSIQNISSDPSETGVATSLLVPGLAGSDVNCKDMRRMQFLTNADTYHQRFSIGSDFRPQGNEWKYLNVFGKPYQSSDPTSGGDLLTSIHRLTELSSRDTIPDRNFYLLDKNLDVHFGNYFMNKDILNQIEGVLLPQESLQHITANTD